MYELHLDAYMTCGVAAIVYWIGRYLATNIPLLKKYCIPAPVVGGFLFSLLNTILAMSGVMRITFDGYLQTFFMTMFWATVGYAASIKSLIQGGKNIAKLFVLCVAMILLQSFLGVGLADMLGIDNRLGLSLGPVSLMGGPGTAAAFGSTMDAMGITGASSVGLAAATFGLVVGGIIGNPIAQRRIKQFKLHSDSSPASAGDVVTADEESGTFTSTTKDFVQSLLLLVVALGLGIIVSNLLTKATGFTFPSYIGAMTVGAIIRNISDVTNKRYPAQETEVIGSMSLTIFLTSALMGLKLWELVDLALPMIIILILQTIMLVLFAYYICFYFMGKDYESAVLTTGFVGFALGTASNSIANMETLSKRYGPPKSAFFVIPMTGLFFDFANALIINTYLNFLS